MNIIKQLKNIKSKFDTKVFDDADCRVCKNCTTVDTIVIVREKMKVKDGVYTQCKIEIEEDGFTYRKKGLVCLAKIEKDAPSSRIINIDQSIINNKKYISYGECDKYDSDWITSIGIFIVRVLTLIFSRRIRSKFISYKGGLH